MAGRKVPKSLTEEQINTLLEQVAGKSSMALRNRSLLILMVDGGLRLDEALSLEARDLRPHWRSEVTALHLTHTKGNRERVVPLTPRARDALARWLERREALDLRNGLVFTTLSEGKRRSPRRGKKGFVSGETVERQLKPGRKINQRYVRALVSRLSEKAGLPEWATPHTLRHTAAQRMYDHTRDIETVRKFLGHQRVTTTQVYAEASDEDVQRAVEGLEPEKELTLEQQVAALQEQVAKLLAR